MTPYHENIVYESEPHCGFLGDVSISWISMYFINIFVYDGGFPVSMAVPCVCLYNLLLKIK